MKGRTAKQLLHSLFYSENMFFRNIYRIQSPDILKAVPFETVRKFKQAESSTSYLNYLMFALKFRFSLYL